MSEEVKSYYLVIRSYRHKERCMLFTQDKTKALSLFQSEYEKVHSGEIKVIEIVGTEKLEKFFCGGYNRTRW